MVENSPKAWRAAFRRLIEAEALRTRLVQRARQDVIDGFTTAGNTDLYLDILSDARRGGQEAPAVAIAK